VDAEIISVGDELTSGQRLNTNSHWLSQQLGDLGVRTIRHTTIGDDLDANVEAFRAAAARARYVIISGGLGPTLDDLTREAMAIAFECPLELDDASLQHIQHLFARRQRPMPERNRVQAMFPKGSQVVPNPHGSAPGIDLNVQLGNGSSSRLFALPGVPAEMFQMWHETVAPRIEREMGAIGQLRFHAIKVYGIGESDVEVKLPTLIARDRQPTVGITVSRATITLRITSRAQSEEAFQQLIAPTVAEIHAALGELIFGEGTDELQHAVLRLLVKHNLSLACVEVGASSLLPDMLHSAGLAAAKHIRGCLAFPSLENAHCMLDDSAAGDTRCLDLQQIMAELAIRTRMRLGADIGLACGIYPTDEELEQSAQSFGVAYAISTDAGEQAEIRHIGGHPEVVTARIAKTALDMVRHLLRLR
jgi:nicotinamide-nucleotide amidase